MFTWSLVSFRNKLKASNYPLFIRINNDELLLLPQKTKSKPQDDVIWKYHLMNHTWNKMMTYPKDLVSTKPHSAVFDKERECVYVCDYESTLYQVNCDTKELIVLSKTANFEECPLMFKVNQDIHILGRNKRYNIFNTISNTLHELQYPVSWHLSPHSVTMKGRNSIITMGTKREQSGKAVFSLIEYSLTKNQWIEWDIKGLNNYLAKIVKTKNEQYLILFGGWNVEKCEYSKQIYVLDLKMKILRKSSIRLPLRFVFCSICEKTEIANLLVFGYVNQLWQTEEYLYIQSLPFYLIKLIEKWICFQYIHLVGQLQLNCRHWIMNVDDIIKSAQDCF